MNDAQLRSSTSAYQQLVADILLVTYTNQQKRQERSLDFERLVHIEQQTDLMATRTHHKLRNRVTRQLARALTRFAAMPAHKPHTQELYELADAAFSACGSAELLPIMDQASQLVFSSSGH